MKNTEEKIYNRVRNTNLRILKKLDREQDINHDFPENFFKRNQRIGENRLKILEVLYGYFSFHRVFSLLLFVLVVIFSFAFVKSAWMYIPLAIFGFYAFVSVAMSIIYSLKYYYLSKYIENNKSKIIYINPTYYKYKYSRIDFLFSLAIVFLIFVATGLALLKAFGLS